MNDLGRVISLSAIDQYRDFNLGGGDQLNVDTGFTETFEKFRGHAGMRSHSNSETRPLLRKSVS